MGVQCEAAGRFSNGGWRLFEMATLFWNGAKFKSTLNAPAAEFFSICACWLRNVIPFWHQFSCINSPISYDQRTELIELTVFRLINHLFFLIEFFFFFFFFNEIQTKSIESISNSINASKFRELRNYGWREQEWAQPISGDSADSADSADSGGCAGVDPTADWYSKSWYRGHRSP